MHSQEGVAHAKVRGHTRGKIFKKVRVGVPEEGGGRGRYPHEKKMKELKTPTDLGWAFVLSKIKDFAGFLAGDWVDLQFLDN